MVISWVATWALASSWIELTAGLPPNDDLTTIQFGATPDELWVGTADGLVWRSFDNGESWALAFVPRDAEPLVEPQLAYFRAPSVGDLARGTDRDVGPRERASMAKRASDLAGAVRDRPRDRSTPLLGSLVRDTVRENLAVKYVERCHGRTWVVTSETIWRSDDDGVHFSQIALGPMGRTGELGWLSCDGSRPGHIVVSTGGGVLESWDWGDTFGLWSNIFPETSFPASASMGPKGRLMVTSKNRVFLETPDRTGYELVCHFTGDSVEADQISFSWYAGDRNELFVVTKDGILVCAGDKIFRLKDERLARRPAKFVWPDWTLKGHLLVTTEYEVFESFDDGETFDLVFTAPTPRTIRNVVMHPDRKGDMLVLTGGQIYRRVSDADAGRFRESQSQTEARLDRLMTRTPLWDVVQTSLDRVDLSAGRLVSRRIDLRLRSLLPAVIARVSWLNDDYATSLLNRAGPPVFADQTGQNLGDRAIWSVFFLWDLRDFILDPMQTSRSWVDVDRLRQRITYRVEDTYVLWARESMALGNPNLTTEQRVYHELNRREASVYLDQMTGGKFPAFKSDQPIFEQQSGVSR